MADLSLLMRRAGGHFAADARFDGADPIAAHASVPVMPPGDPLAEARCMGFDEGFAEGHAQALAQAQAASDIRERLASSFARLDAERTEALRQQLLGTVVALCEATLAPLALDRAALAHRVERAVAMFTRADDDRVIRLNPDDLATVQGLLPPDWQFLPDASLERGALRLEMANGGVEDGPMQWRQALAEALDLC